VAHLSDGALRRIVDDPVANNGADVRHLESCPACNARLKSVAEDARSITSLMATPELKLDVAAAFNRVQAAPAAPRFGFRLPVARPGSRPMVLAFAAVVAAVALLATVIAEDKYTFSPNTLTPVPVTMADMESLSQLSAYGTITWTTRPQPQIVASVDEAEKISGLKAPKAGSVPAGVSTNVTYAAMPQAVGVFTFSQAKASAAAAQSGKTLPALPAGMEGAQLTVTVGPAIAEIFGNMTPPAAGSDVTTAGLPQLVVAESSAPVATSTQVSVQSLEAYLLSLPGLSPQLTAAIKAIGDPSTTLPVPVPIEFGTSSTVDVQGVKGLALGDNTGVGAGVIWVKNSVVYGVIGTIKKDDAINIANHLT
jgi:hypothetical protein